MTNNRLDDDDRRVIAEILGIDLKLLKIGSQETSDGWDLMVEIENE